MNNLFPITVIIIYETSKETNMNKAFFYFKRYIQVYDPGYFNLIYAIKSLVAIFLSILINYLLFGSSVLVWAGITPMQLFFINAIVSPKTNKRLYMFLFSIFSSICVGVFYSLSVYAFGGGNFGVLYLVSSITLLSFIVSMSKVYDPELYKMMVPVLVNSLVACLYVESGVYISAIDQMITILIGTLIAFVIGVLLLDNSSSYGKYAKVYFPMLITNIINMVKNIDNAKEFNRYKQVSFIMINDIKNTLHEKSGYSKNVFIVKNIKRAIFYAYKIEDIFISINILHVHFLEHKNVKPLQREILVNLNQLKKIFNGRLPKIYQFEYSKILNNKAQERTALTNSLTILYEKMDNFWRVGNNSDIALVQTPKRTFKSYLKVFNFNNETFKFSIKYSLAIGISIVFASLFQLRNGIWISLGIIPVIRPSIGGIGNIGKEYFIGAGIGILVGIFISLFIHGIAFYFIFAVVIFLIVYFRSFTYGMWSGAFMCGFVMMYSLLYSDFIVYVLDRLLDIGVGIIFSIIIFLLIWPKYSQDDFLPQIKAQNMRLKDILKYLKLSQLDHSVNINYNHLQNIQTEFYNNLIDLKQIVQDSKTEKLKHPPQIIKDGHKIIDILDKLHSRVGELIQFCFSIDKENQKSQMYGLDIKILETRAKMINNLILKEDHFFKKEDMFLSKDSNYFNWIILNIFDLQNNFYDILNNDLE